VAVKKLTAVMAVGVIMLELAGIAQSAVVINEVFYDAVGVDTGKEWIELKNTNATPETIAGHDLNAVSGDYYTFPELTVPPGNFVIIYWRKNGTDETDFSDNVVHLYTGTSGFANMGNTSGFVALFNSTTHSSSTIIDYMEYGAGGQTWENTAVSAGIWTAGDYSLDVDEGHSLEYDDSGNTGSDWFDQSVPTPGIDNSLPVTLTSFTASAGDGEVSLRWVTESKVNNLGFNIYRARREKKKDEQEEPKEGEYVKINSELIPGAGTSTVKHSYCFTDRNVDNGTTYFYRLEDVSLDGESTFHGPVEVVPRAEQEEQGEELPHQPRLEQNFPNPFNPETSIRFVVPLLRGEPAVFLEIYTLAGQRVRTLLQRSINPGFHQLVWDSRDQNGTQVASGVYLYVLKVGGELIDTRKMALIR
jgi:hypothetical protein